MKATLFLLIYFVFITTLHAQDTTCILDGYVFGAGEPLRSISVMIEGKRKGTTTNESGYFSFKHLPRGSYNLQVSGIGFQRTQVHIDASASHVSIDSIVLNPSTNHMEDVVVSGTMKAVSKMDSPIPVEVYSPVLFKKNPTPNIFESLTMINGVQPQLNCNVCNTGDIHINGMEGPYTMILIDGMPIVSSLSTVYGLSGIPNSLVKRIEIVKGPASTLYGSEAVGGLINIITKDPVNADKFKVDVSATTIGEYNVDIATKRNTRIGTSMLGINLFNYWQKRDINHDNFTDVTLQNRISIFNKWSFKRKRNLQANVALRYVYENRWGGELQWHSGLRGSNTIYGETILTNRVEVIGQYQMAATIFADVSYNYHLQDSYYGDTKYYADQHVAFAQLRWSKTLKQHDVLIGIPFRFTRYDDNSPATFKDGKNKPDETILPGIFIQDEFKPSAKISTLIGLRYDYNNNHGSIFSPRLSIKYAPNKSNTIRLSGGNGYRVVNLFTEDHAALTGARDVVIAEALKPEQSWNINANYTTVINRSTTHITLDGSLFYTYFTNKIVADFITDPAKIIYDNLRGFAISKGITINTDFDMARRLKVNAGITLMDVYSMDEDSLKRRVKVPQLFAPKFSGTYAITYTFPQHGLAIDWTGKLNGPMFLPVVPNDFRPAKSPFYAIMNVQFTKTFKQWELYTGLKNLLNFLPKNPLLHPDDPFNKPGGKYFDINGQPRADTNPNAYVFDPSYNFAPVQGVKGFLGVRFTVK